MQSKLILSENLVIEKCGSVGHLWCPLKACKTARINQITLDNIYN